MGGVSTVNPVAVTAVTDPRAHWLAAATETAAGLPPELALPELRTAARTRFERLGLPSRTLEAWRTTDIAPLRGLEPRRAGTGRAPDAGWLAGLPAGPRVVLVDGRVHAIETGELPAGVSVLGFAEAARRLPQVLAALDTLPGLDAHAFAALNSALFEDGVLVHVAAGARLDALTLAHWSSGDGTAVHPRLLLVLEDGAGAGLLEWQGGQGTYLSTALTEVRLGRGAQLALSTVQDESAEAFQLGGLRAQLAADAKFSLRRWVGGGRIGRMDLALTLEGEGAAAELDGLVLAGGTQLLDHHLELRHAVARCTSRQTFRGVLAGKAKHVFDGLIRVDPDAQQTDAQQQCRNLLLSKQALTVAIPRLEILADDVKCAHGATVGALDEDALFYLRARGIGLAEARTLLVRAFAGEFLDALTDEAMRAALETRLDAWMEVAA